MRTVFAQETVKNASATIILSPSLTPIPPPISFRKKPQHGVSFQSLLKLKNSQKEILLVKPFRVVCKREGGGGEAHKEPSAYILAKLWASENKSLRGGQLTQFSRAEWAPSRGSALPVTLSTPSPSSGEAGPPENCGNLQQKKNDDSLKYVPLPTSEFVCHLRPWRVWQSSRISTPIDLNVFLGKEAELNKERDLKNIGHLSNLFPGCVQRQDSAAIFCQGSGSSHLPEGKF